MRFVALFIFVLVILADLFSKSIAKQAGQAYFNQGVSFGLVGVEQTDFMVGLLFLLGLVVTVGAVKISAQNRDAAQDIALALFLGGVWANLLDRLISGGAVRDWLKVPGLDLYNNLADWSIFIGVILWISILFLKTKTSSSSTSQPE